MELTIRKSTFDDLEDIKKIISISRELMIARGNPNQWGKTRPSLEVLINDIEKENSYVCIKDGQVVGCFALVYGEDPTYQEIYQGQWSADLPYWTIHRLGSDGLTCGVGQACFAFAKEQGPYLRVDTHQENTAMIKAIKRAGFKNCGIIFVEDGSPRIAFDFLKK
ncbi:MAG: GNAT family N-acetyltransferase [Bacillota bacterium]|nr:GNAT family N-acetyltransferase [Bacillota bacterium]